MRRLDWLAVTAVTTAAAVAWSVPTPDERARDLLVEQVTAWEMDREATVAELRALNPEWDFMWRTFLVLSLADRALANPEQAERWLAVMDDVLRDTLQVEASHGQRAFLMAYADRAPFVDPAGRSLFVDGEIALMAGARRLVRDEPWVAAEHRARVEVLERAFARGPLPESYPDEAWLFCVTNAWVAIRMSDALDGTDHAPEIAAWTDHASRRLREPGTGLLGSSYTTTGTPLDGPEGSTIWLVATNLLLLDPTLARHQYSVAHDELVHSVAGFAWASEWGSSWRGPTDVDSGPIVPLVDASPSSSGFAILASRAFDDPTTFRRLTRSLVLADLVVALDPRLAVLADNPMGDVIVLHGLTHGPLWEAVRERVGIK